MELFKKKVPVGGSMVNPTRKKLTRIGGFIVLAFVALAIVLVIATPSDPEAKPQVAKTPNIGDEAYISWPGGSAALLGVTKDDMSQIIKSLTAKDVEGGAEMILNERAFLVPSGTKVRVIDFGFTGLQVRVLEGEQYGKSGWLPNEFVKPEKTLN